MRYADKALFALLGLIGLILVSLSGGTGCTKGGVATPQGDRCEACMASCERDGIPAANCNCRGLGGRCGNPQ